MGNCLLICLDKRIHVSGTRFLGTGFRVGGVSDRLWQVLAYAILIVIASFFMFDAFVRLLETTPLETLASYALIFVGTVAIISVLIWGFATVWLDTKQGQYWSNIKWSLLAISVPQDSVNTPKGMENFFNSIAGSKSSITWKEKWLWGKFQAYFSLEIVSMEGRIQFYVRTPIKYRDNIESALYAQYPEAQITEVEDFGPAMVGEYPNEEWDCFGSEMVFRKPNYMPIKTYEMFEHVGEKDFRFKDPMLTMIENLGKMGPGEQYYFQILIMQPDEQDWVKEGRAYIEGLYGKTTSGKKAGLLGRFFGGWANTFLSEATGNEGDFITVEETVEKPDAFQMFKLTPEERDAGDAVKEKISRIGWYSKIRFCYIARKEVFRKGTIASMTKGMMHPYAHPSWNKIGIHGPSTTKDDYFWQAWQMPRKQRELVDRFKWRKFSGGSTPYIMNSAELATLFHFPAADARTPVLTALGARRSEAPTDLTYAQPNIEILPNANRGNTEVVTPDLASVEQKPLSVPSVTSPTGFGEDRAFDRAPQPQRSPGMNVGVPAPLPPGVEDRAVPAEESIPGNLPIKPM